MSLKTLYKSTCYIVFFICGGCFFAGGHNNAPKYINHIQITAKVLYIIDRYPIIYKQSPFPKIPDEVSAYKSASILKIENGGNYSGKNIIIFYESTWPQAKMLALNGAFVTFDIQEHNLISSLIIENEKVTEPYIFAGALINLKNKTNPEDKP